MFFHFRKEMFFVFPDFNLDKGSVSTSRSQSLCLQALQQRCEFLRPLFLPLYETQRTSASHHLEESVYPIRRSAIIDSTSAGNPASLFACTYSLPPGARLDKIIG